MTTSNMSIDSTAHLMAGGLQVCVDSGLQSASTTGMRMILLWLVNNLD